MVPFVVCSKSNDKYVTHMQDFLDKFPSVLLRLTESMMVRLILFHVSKRFVKMFLTFCVDVRDLNLIVSVKLLLTVIYYGRFTT